MPSSTYDHVPQGILWVCWGSMGIWRAFECYIICVYLKLELFCNLKSVPSMCWTTPRLPIVNNPACGVQGQDLRVQSWRGGCLVWEPQSLILAFHSIIIAYFTIGSHGDIVQVSLFYTNSLSYTYTGNFIIVL